MWGIGWVCSTYLINLEDLFINTFLSSMIGSINLISLIITKILFYATTIYMVLAIPTMAVIYFIEIRENSKKR